MEGGGCQIHRGQWGIRYKKEQHYQAFFDWNMDDWLAIPPKYKNGKEKYFSLHCNFISPLKFLETNARPLVIHFKGRECLLQMHSSPHFFTLSNPMQINILIVHVHTKIIMYKRIILQWTDISLNKKTTNIFIAFSTPCTYSSTFTCNYLIFKTL